MWLTLAYPYQGCSRLPHSYWSSYEYLTHCQSEDSHAHQMVIYVPPPTQCWHLNLEWLSYSKHIVHSHLGIQFQATPNHIPLKHRCPIKISNQIWHAFLNCMLHILQVEGEELTYRFAQLWVNSIRIELACQRTLQSAAKFWVIQFLMSSIHAHACVFFTKSMSPSPSLTETSQAFSKGGGEKSKKASPFVAQVLDTILYFFKRKHSDNTHGPHVQLKLERWDSLKDTPSLCDIHKRTNTKFSPYAFATTLKLNISCDHGSTSFDNMLWLSFSITICHVAFVVAWQV